ncbi:MAG TPA: tRNA 2-thiouridine(34) synthase MnmA [Desulfobulbus sp.]|nr:tRNA 2-thiouridine(34) synthase MnmA [Desulfobulbus sp.]
MSGTRIGMAMSGGVDSTVSATLLREQGYQVEGFFMLLPVAGLEEQIRRVRHLAGQLRIPLHLVDLRQEFGQVIRYFVDSYRQGLTPNPCIRCNPEIKFGALFAAMQKHNMEQMATGHYARVLRAGDGSAALHRGLAPGKDQSYFLCRLPAGLLERIVLPLGEWHKTEVYERAARLGLTGFDGQESQDVCFLDQGLSAFLRRQGMTDSEGEIVSSDGRVLGRHRGIWHYTVGQRRGLGLPDATPWYVIGLDGRRNRVIVGKNDELFSATVMVRDLHWLAPAALPWQGLVQLRSRHRAAPARLEQAGTGGWRIRFDTPQRAITPGQFAVLYQDDRLVASAVITGPGHPERDTTDT